MVNGYLHSHWRSFSRIACLVPASPSPNWRISVKGGLLSLKSGCFWAIRELQRHTNGLKTPTVIPLGVPPASGAAEDDVQQESDMRGSQCRAGASA